VEAACEEESKSFHFGELQADAKDRALDAHRQINVDFDGWWDGVYEDWKEKLEGMGFLEPKIWFRGFSSQGDGACFDCGHIDVRKFASGKKEDFIRLLFPHINKYLDAVENCISFAVKENSYATHYCHWNTRYVDWEVHTNYEEELGVHLSAKFEDKVKEMGDLIEQVRADLSKEIYADLEKEYDYLTSDEAVGEALEANDYLFDEEGNNHD
jgi:hypothetical protein